MHSKDVQCNTKAAKDKWYLTRGAKAALLLCSLGNISPPIIRVESNTLTASSLLPDIHSISAKVCHSFRSFLKNNDYFNTLTTYVK